VADRWFFQQDVKNPGLVACWRNYYYNMPDQNAGFCFWIQLDLENFVPGPGPYYVFLLYTPNYHVQWRCVDGIEGILFYYKDTLNVVIFQQFKPANIRDGKAHWIACWFDDSGNAYIRVDDSVTSWQYTPVGNGSMPVYFIVGSYGCNIGAGASGQLYIDDVRLFYDTTNWSPDTVYADGRGIKCDATWFTGVINSNGWFCEFDGSATATAIVNDIEYYDQNTAYADFADGGVVFPCELPKSSVAINDYAWSW
jgi:hypothetical protein